MKIFSECPIGFEDIAQKEVAELIGKKRLQVGKGSFVLKASKEEAALLSYASQALERVNLLLFDGNFSTLKQAQLVAESLSYSNFIAPEQSFAVDCKRFGKHAFHSPDIEAAIGQGVIDSYLKEKGVRLRVDLSRPNVTVRVYVVGERLLIGIDLSGPATMRGYRMFRHRGMINPCLAYCMLREAGWKPQLSLLDPLCTDGTILIEACLWAKNIKQGSLVFILPFEKILGIAPSKLAKAFKPKSPKLSVLGIVQRWKFAKGTKENIFSAGLAEDIQIKRARLPAIGRFGKFDRIITSLPFYLIDRPQDQAKALCAKFLRAIKQVSTERTIAVLLTNVPETFEEAVKEQGLKILSKRDIEQKEFLGAVFRIGF